MATDSASRAHSPPKTRPSRTSRASLALNERAYHRFLALANSDEAIMVDALRIYDAYVAHALCEHHKRAPLALVNAKMRWTLAQVARIIATLETTEART